MNIREIWLITNYSCNNRCKWCYTNEKGFPQEIMPNQYAMDILKEAAINGVERCTLIGGEPLLYPHVYELVKYGTQVGLKMKIVTNAVLLKNFEVIEKLIDNGLSSLALSIHGVNVDAYKENTQTDRFNDVLDAISNLQRLNVDFVTLTTINKLNVEKIYDIAVFLKKHFVRNIIFNIAVPNSGDLSNSYALSYEDIASAIMDNYLSFRKENIIAHFYASIPLCFFDFEILDKMIKDGYLIPLSRGGCNVFDSSGFAIDPQGNILPCCKEISTSLMNTMGANGIFLQKGNFKSIVQTVEAYCKKVNKITLLDKCDHCLKKSDCIGGCLMFWKYDDSLKRKILSLTNANTPIL